MIEEPEGYPEKEALSLRLQEALDVFRSRKITTPKQLAKLLSRKQYRM